MDGSYEPVDQVNTALDALAASFTDDRREFAIRLGPVIAGSSELREPRSSASASARP